MHAGLWRLWFVPAWLTHTDRHADSFSPATCKLLAQPVELKVLKSVNACQRMWSASRILTTTGCFRASSASLLS